MKCFTDIYVPQRMTHSDFVDPVAFHSAPAGHDCHGSSTISQLLQNGQHFVGKFMVPRS